MVTSDEQQILNLMYRYMEATDDGDFATRAQLFEHATIVFPEPMGSLTGGDAIAANFASRQRLYDGIPRTSHICTNVHIEISADRSEARARSRYLVLQETEDLPLQPIITGRYHDRFERVDGAWRFAERRFVVDLVGDMSAHHQAGVTHARDLR